MNTIKIEIDENKLKELVADYIESRTGQSIPIDKIKIEVKSKQNYKAEWETASFRASAESLI